MRPFLAATAIPAAATLLLFDLACDATRAADPWAKKEIYRLDDAKTLRRSTADEDWQAGNSDSRGIEPGGVLTVADIDGPGIIRHIWFTMGSRDLRYPRAVVLRMYWDGAEAPAVESPVGDFFAVGHGMMRYVDSLPVSVTSEGRALNCYWPMPFHKHARITLANESAESVGVYYYVDYQKVPALPPDTAYFHAQYRQEYPVKLGPHYLVFEGEGRGHYVGTVLSVVNRTRGWFGEGDDCFFIDGEPEPSLRGTGTEDYFCDAFGFREFGRPYYGVSSYEGYDVGDRTTVFRWHIPDPVHFTKSLKVTIEHRGSMFDDLGRGTSGFAERADLFSSVAFWYQVGHARRFTTLPPAAERIVPTTVIELEDFAADARVTPAETVVEPSTSSLFSGQKQLLARFKSEGAWLEIPFTTDRDLKGAGRLRLACSQDCGAWKVLLDGKPFGTLTTVDLFRPHLSFQECKLGMIEIPAGRHVLSFHDVGKNPASRGHLLGVDAILIEDITPYAVPATQPEKG